MELNEIRKLIEKFYDGKTSLEEEVRLRGLLKTVEGLSEFENEQDLFTSFEQRKNEAKPPEKLQAELTELVDKKWKAISLQRFRKSVQWTMVAAASLAIFLISYRHLTRSESAQISAPTQEEQEAFRSTKQALSYVSVAIKAERSKLSGLSQISKGFTALNELSIINNSINQFKTEEQ